MASSTTNGFTHYSGRSGILGPDGKPWQHDLSLNPNESFPYPLQFQTLLNGAASQTFRQWMYDEALKHDHEYANQMRNDAFLAALVEERKMAVTSLEWHLEVEDERDPRQVAVRDGLTTWLKTIPCVQKMVDYLLEAVWPGRYGSQLAIDRIWQTLDLPDLRDPSRRVPMRCPRITGHLPVDGDSIIHKLDGTPCVLINGAMAKRVPAADTIQTNRGRALVLNGTWKNKFIIHRHKSVAGFYNDPTTAERAYGVGLRSDCYYWQWIKMEIVTNILDWCQRTGLGVRVWKFQGSNPQSKASVMAAASEFRGDKVNLFVPVWGERNIEGVEYLEPNSTGATFLIKLQEYIDKILERRIVGQSMSGGSDEGNGLGGTGRADLAADTKAQNTQFDANNLAETLTNDLVLRGLKWIYPADCHNIPVSWKFVREKRDTQKVMAAVKDAVSMGLGSKIRAEDVVGLTGLPIAKDGDMTVAQAMQEQQKQQMEQQAAAQQQQMQAQAGQQGAAQPPQELQPPPDSEDLTKTGLPLDPGDDELLTQIGYQLGGQQGSQDDEAAFQQFLRHGEPERYEVRHAPPGGVTIQGQSFVGGQFIPGEVLAKATPQEKAQLGAPPGGASTPAASPKPTGQPPGQPASEPAAKPAAQPGQPKQQAQPGATKEGQQPKPGEISPEVQHAAQGVLGRPVTMDDLHNLIGAQDGFKTEAFVKNSLVVINTTGQNGEVGSYILMNQADENGQMRRTLNTAFVSNGKGAGQGKGREMFAKSVEHARKMGVERLTLNAARGDKNGEQLVGYAVWPKFGFDAPLELGSRQIWAMPLKMKWQYMTGKLKTVQDLQATPEGVAFWKEHGDSANMSFDLSEGSLSSHKLAAYQAAKKQQGQPSAQPQPITGQPS